MKQRNKPNDTFSRKFAKYGDSDDDDETELLAITKPTRREIPSIEKAVEEGDTLQSLAIRYHCTIEDLKRLNNIHKDNEIFAKRTIRVPHRPISMALAGVHGSGTSSPDDSVKPVDADLLSLELSTSLVSLNKSSQEAEVNQIIFNSNIVQKTPETVCLDADFIDENDEEVRLLPQKDQIVEPLVAKIDCSGVDGGLSIRALIFCIIVAIVVIPLVYVFYIAEHPEEYHHNS